MSAPVTGLLACWCVVLLAWSVRVAPRVFASGDAVERLHQQPRKFEIPPLKSLAVFAAVAVPLATLRFVGIVPALLLGVFEFAGQRWHSSYQQRKAAEQYERDVPLVLDEIARNLRTGAGFLVAFKEAANSAPREVGIDLRRIARHTDHGQGIVEALKEWRLVRPNSSVVRCVAIMTLALETGGAQASAIDSVAATLRQSLSAADMALTSASESRMSAVIITLMPVVVSGPLLFTSEDARNFMFHNPIGIGITLAGVAFDALGAWWMSVLIKRALR